jgi:hypothetical protein
MNEKKEVQPAEGLQERLNACGLGYMTKHICSQCGKSMYYHVAHKDSDGEDEMWYLDCENKLYQEKSTQQPAESELVNAVAEILGEGHGDFPPDLAREVLAHLKAQGYRKCSECQIIKRLRKEASYEQEKRCRADGGKSIYPDSSP